ncbi:TonB-dependent receptor [Aurantiacibacter suaedae]|uniref:TonB-dependent receptor n=1 Tax=Aurantiacibacter suaedae TaxID=2545755 RepID=UPI0010F4D389|nr:TonB-dependent receptor [Aurantiacibacter suaedae]
MKFKSLSVVSSLAIMAGMAAPAFAQDEEEGARTNTIVVTAEFREANLQDTPIAITAVNSEMLEARGQTDIAQVAAQAPNVTLKAQPQGGGSGLIAFIRGVGQVDFNYALDPGVGVYIDDVFIPTLSSSLLDLMDLDRIEVLRGPQGTLAGKNSIGGAIKLFSARPQGDNSGSFRATYGSYNRIEARGMADFAITDNLFARVSGIGRSVDGYVTRLDYATTHPDSNVPANNARGRGNAGNETLGGGSTVAGRLALRWVPTDRLEVNVSGDYSSDKGEAGPQVLLAMGAVSDTPETFDPFSQNPAVSLGEYNPAAPFIPGVGRYETLPWLVGKDGNAVPGSCAFVPSGPYSCDTGGNLQGLDPRFINYGNFLDARQPTSQAPYKPYATNPISELVGWGVHGNITFDATENLQLVWIGSWREYQSNWGEDQDGTPIPVAQLDNQLNHRAWSQEVRVNFELADGLIEGTVGGYYLDQDGEYTARVDLNYAGIDFIHGPDTTPSTTKAGFGTLTIRPTDSLSFTGGIRYTKDEKIYTYFRSNPDGTAPFDVNADGTPDIFPPACESFVGAGPVIRDADGNVVLGPNGLPQALPTALGNTPNCLLVGLFDVSDTFEGDRWDWRLAADYRFSDGFLVYASASTGFKGGGVNPRPFFGPSAGSCDPADGYVAGPCNQLKAFNPETITTYELGFKSDLLDRRLRLNGAAFFNKYDNIILQLSACPSTPCLQPNNVGSADVKGFELEMSAYPVDGLSLDGGLSYIDFEYTDVGASGLIGNEVTPFTPEWTYSFGIQYDYEMDAGTLMARFDGAYQSEIFTDSFNTSWSKIDSYFLGNARLGFTTADEDWNVALEVQNVFDKYYFLTVSDVTTSLGLVTAQPGMPRTWSLSVGRKF